MATHLLSFVLLLALLSHLVSATTRSPEFLGLSPAYGLWPETGFGESVIIGVVDTRVWPESPSFRDPGLPPVPLTWHGECVAGDRFDTNHCNRKLIGARAFFNGTEVRGVLNGASTFGDYSSPGDDIGHGTHTASTATGSDVPHASVFSFASGTARGIAPRALAKSTTLACGTSEDVGVWDIREAGNIGMVPRAVPLAKPKTLACGTSEPAVVGAVWVP